jgi:hypothetical protein
MKKYFLAMLLMALTVIIISCGENGVEPELQPGRRDYVWSEEILDAGTETVYLGRIWGSDSKDIWATGMSSWSLTTIWHYNGVRWGCDSIPRMGSPFGIFGFSKDEVWLGNANSTIWKYNGKDWAQFGQYSLDGFDQVTINYFDGLSRDNVYGVGSAELYGANKWKAIIMNYNGYRWYFEKIPEVKVGLETVAVDKNSGVLVMSGTANQSGLLIAKLYCWDGSEFKELLSEPGWSFVTKLGDEIYATSNTKIYKYNNKQLTLWKDNIDLDANSNIICGRSRNDFFYRGVNGINHFNGTDFTTLYKTNLPSQWGIAFEKDVFIIGVDYQNGKTHIIHGKLK